MIAARAARRRRVWGAILLICALIVSVEPPGRTLAAERPVRVFLVDYGWHVGLAFERRWFGADDPLVGLPKTEWVEIGWGEERFYRETASFDDFDPIMGLRAFLGMGESVVHAVALPAPPDRTFRPEALTPLALDAGGAQALAAHVAASVRRPVAPVGEGWWPGASQFYRSGHAYSAFHICNHWASDALNAAGLPSSSVWSTLPSGLRAELRWRL